MKREKYAIYVTNEKEAKTAKKMIKKSKKLKYVSTESVEIPWMLFDVDVLAVICSAKKRKHFDKFAAKVGKELGQSITLF